MCYITIHQYYNFAIFLNETPQAKAPPCSLTVSQYLDNWLAHKSTEVRPSTLQSYRTVIQNHLKPYLGEYQLTELLSRHIDQWHKTMQAGNLTHRTLVYAHHLLVAALNHAVRLELLTCNPAEKIKLPRRVIPKAEMNVWTPEQVATFLNATQEHRLYALFYLALATGLRRGELLALTWEKVDLERGVLQVSASLTELKGGRVITEPKTRASKRTVYLAADVVAVLRQQQQRLKEERTLLGTKWTDLNLVFPTPLGTYLDSANLTRTFKSLSKVAGVPVIRLHDLRHTHASLLALKGVAPKVIADRLGHTNVSFTLQVYTHLYDEQRREAAPNLAELVAPKKVG